MNDPSYKLIDIATALRKQDLNWTLMTPYEISVRELSEAINNVIFDSLKEGRDPDDVLRALNEIGNVLVSQTQEYDEFAEAYEFIKANASKNE